MGFEIPITFQGRNLAIYTVRGTELIVFIINIHRPCLSGLNFVHLQGHKFTIGTELMKNTEREVIQQQQESKFTFSGYKVSMDITHKTVFLVQTQS